MRFYESANGDVWDLILENAASAAIVKHTPNLASGGKVSQVAMKDFLRIEPHTAQCQALVAYLDSTQPEKPTVRSYINEPKEPDGPYIAVILSDGVEPIVTLHKSYAEAEIWLKGKVDTPGHRHIER